MSKTRLDTTSLSMKNCFNYGSSHDCLVERVQRTSGFTISSVFLGFLAVRLVWILTCSFLVLCPIVISASESVQASDHKVAIFPPESADQSLVSLIGNQVESIVESPNGGVIIASRNGVLTFDSETEDVRSSYEFDHTYDNVQVIATKNSVWIHGRIDRAINLPRLPIEQTHELFRLGDASPSYSVKCISVGIDEFVGYQVVDFEGDSHPSLVTLCWDGKNSHYANVIDLNSGTIKKIDVPFPASGALIGEHVLGRQSLVLLSFDPRTLWRCFEGSPISGCGVSQSITGVTLVIEKNTDHEVVGRIAESIPTADSYENHSVAGILYSKVYLNGELLLNNPISKGQLFLQWTVKGKLRNGWYFKRSEKLRDILKWIDLPQSTSNSKGISAVVLTRAWGDWCRGTDCGYRIIQLSNDGAYRVIDSTSHKIDDIMISSDRVLYASWLGEVYRYDLMNIEESVPWQESQMDEKTLQWISEHVD